MMTTHLIPAMETALPTGSGVPATRGGRSVGCNSTGPQASCLPQGTTQLHLQDMLHLSVLLSSLSFAFAASVIASMLHLPA